MSGVEPLMFYVGKGFIEKAKKVFKMGFIARKPLLQILRGMGLQPVEVDEKEALKSIEEFAGGGISTASKEAIKALLTPVPALMSRKTVSLLGAYDLGFGMLLEVFTQINRPFGAPIVTYVWIAVPKAPEGFGQMAGLLRGIRDRVGEQPITPEEWKAVQPIVEKLSESGFAIKGLRDNLWVSM